MKLTLTSLIACMLFLGACQKEKKNDVDRGAGGASADSVSQWDGMSHRGNSKFSATATP